MKFQDLRKFIDYLETNGKLVRITHPVTAKLEITEISQRVLKNGGPALLFENVIKDNGEKSRYPVLTNLYAHIDRIANGMGLKDKNELQTLGELFAFLRQPSPPSDFKELISLLPTAKRIFSMAPKTIKTAVCQEVIFDKPDLTDFPIQTCWPNDVSPLITWPLIVTKGPTKDKIDNYNLGIYRLQLVNKNKLIMRWLKMRGGEQQYRRSKEQKIKTFPAAAVIGACPAITLAAVMPLPDNMSEYNFAGLIKNKNIELVQCKTIDLKVPAYAEIIIEGEVSFDEYLPEGPFGDHTGYYNEVEYFPVFNIKAITTRKNPIYLSTYTGKPPDETSILGEALNEIFISLIKQQFPEIVDFWLPPEGCSYRIANVSIKKSYPGQAKKIMMGVWSFLRQFMYTKYIIVLDDDINIRDWKEVIWAISTRTDPFRDSIIINNTPIDYLDFASPEASLGSKMGIDATNKIHPETSRNWGAPIKMNQDIIDKINSIWDKLF